MRTMHVKSVSHTFTVHWCLSAAKIEMKVTQKLKVVIVHQMKKRQDKENRSADVLKK